MSMLLELQRSFAASLRSGDGAAIAQHIVEDGFAASERLCIYRNTCRSTLVEALRMTYPAVNRLVGPDFFDTAAGWFVERHPASSAYLNEYGDGFADFIAARKETCSVPYLADVARFEWALGVAANAPDAPALDAQALARVAPEHHVHLRFQPHPSVSVLQLNYPADHIADAVLAGDDAAMAEVDLSSGPVSLVVNRGPGGLETQRLDARSYEFIVALFAGAPLGRLIDLAPDCAAGLLAEQLTKGRLAGLRVPP
jgi:hypothetical protein